MPLAVLAVLVVQALVIPMAGWAAPIPRPEVLDAVLQERLDLGLSSYEVMVQFWGPVLASDLSALRQAGLEARHVFHAIPAVYAVGPADAVFRLSRSDRVFWMEYNEKLTYFMDRSLLTINATKAWDTQVIGRGGSVSAAIDGTGVTVVVVDSGIDAGHPDLDYGSKVIKNLKSDSNFVWTEVENSDTSSGHGTHVAGTVGGTGEASGGARSGVAKGAKLIGLSTGEGPAILNAVGAFEWVYDHSQPGNNPYNIRVCSNSWGSTSEYDHNDAIVQLTEKITYENNVVVTFAAGNEGSADHDGSTRTTNPYCLTPAAIAVAATERDGSGIATFSSRGLATDNFTWPDISTPGVNIWSTQARRTYITALKTQDGDFYYMAISGTSMATPHMSGITALLWQACPSMRVSEYRDDFQGNGQYENASYWNDSATRMHEAEVIMKLTADYIDQSGDNGVPGNSTPAFAKRPMDFAQGYGLVNVHRAVGLALALEDLRQADPDITVMDAYRAYTGMFINRTVSKATNTLKAQWHGEWARFDGNNGSVIYTSQVRNLYIPPGAGKLVLEMQYVAVNLQERYVGTLGIRVDTNGDGAPDFTGSMTPTVSGTRREEIPIGETGIYMGVDVAGQGFGLKYRPTILPGSSGVQYWEITIEYAVTATLIFNTMPNATLNHTDYTPRVAQWQFGSPTSDFRGGNLSLEKPFYDIGAVTLKKPYRPPAGEKPGPQWWLALVLAFVIGAGLGWRELQKRGLDKKYLDPTKWLRKIKLPKLKKS
jgi:serine protease AprX